MGKQGYSAEQIVNKLREADVELSKGMAVKQVCRQIGVTDKTYYRWRREYGGLKVDQAKRMKELEGENARLKRIVANQAIDMAILKEVANGKLLSPSRRRTAVEHVVDHFCVSQRRACRVLHQPRSTQRHAVAVRDDEDALTKDIVELASSYGRYGYRRVTMMLRHSGWAVNHKRVERVWRREGLKVPKKQPKRGRLWLNDGRCVRWRPEHKDHVWAYDFVTGRTHDGRAFKMLVIVDEYTRECLAIDVARNLTSDDVMERLCWLMTTRGVPRHVRSDNGPEFTAKAVREWLGRVGVQTLFIEPGSPWENGYVESLNGKLRDELLRGEIFYSLQEAKVIIEMWRTHYNTVRPHSSLGYRPPAPQTIVSMAGTAAEACSAALRTPLRQEEQIQLR
ncbi:MAG: IS3 family transposase [Phycisphaerales bacterium]